jgi:hypothetical protein
MHIRNINEINAKDLLRVVAQVPHIVSCACEFAEQAIIFRFETNDKRATAVLPDLDETAALVRKEFDKLKRYLGEEATEELNVLAQYIVLIKRPLSLLRQETIKISIQSSHGILTMTVRNLSCVNSNLMRELVAVTKAEASADIVVFLSPDSCQCLRIRMNKRKRTVNV